MDWLEYLFTDKETKGAVEKIPGILVLGAELVCPCGTSHSYLNLNTEHLDIADLPQANVEDSIERDNILPFGICRRLGSVGVPCEKRMDLAERWENSEPQTMLVNGKEVITTESTLVCYVSGREIYAVTSGQEKGNKFAEYKKLCEEMEKAYPGLLDILFDPYGSVYLEAGKYELAIQFLEDYLEETGDELWLSQIYDQKNPKDAFVVAALDRLLIDCDGSNFEQFINGLENTGVQTGMDQKEGWSALKLNPQMIEMLRIDCEATAEKINTSSFARWTEEHKKYVSILGNAVLNLAYDVMLWHCATASTAEKSATYKGGGGNKYAAGDAAFMNPDDAFLRNISNRVDIDENGYFDVIAHGTQNGIQIIHNGEKIIVDSRTAAHLIQNMNGYNGQGIRLLSCNTGSLDNGFAQNLANKLNVEVSAPNNYLWSTSDGNYFVAGMTDSGAVDKSVRGIFRVFRPGGN